MEQKIKILHLEDDAIDAELVHAALESTRISHQLTRVDSSREFSEALRTERFDLILADYKLPDYDGLSALQYVQKSHPEIPFIFVSGTMGEDAAINGLTQGATDYVLKSKLARLAPAVKRALNETEDRQRRQRAEEDLRKSEEFFRSITENSSEIILIVDSEGNLKYVSPSIESVCGYNPQELIGRSVFKFVHPKDLPRAMLEFGQALQRKNILTPISFVVLHKRGTEIILEGLGRNLNDHPSVRGFVVNVHDVTQRMGAEAALRVSEERYRTVIAALAEGIVLQDASGVILACNWSAEKMLGLSQEQMMGRTSLDPRWHAIHEDGSPFAGETHPAMVTLQTGKPMTNTIMGIHKPEGSLNWISINSQPLFNPDRTLPYAVVTSLSDITDIKQHEHEREAIIAVANAIRTAATRSEILEAILDQLNGLFEADGAMLAIRDVIGIGILIEMGRGKVGEKFTGLHIPPEKGISNWVIETKQSYFCNKAGSDPRFYRPDLLGESQAMAAVPLVAQEQVIGALWIARKNEITENNVRLLNAIADLAANAIQRVTLYEQTERQVHRLMALHQIDITISASFDLTFTLNILLNSVVSQLDVDAADILLLTPHSQTLAYSAGAGFWSREIEQSKIQMGEGQAGIAASQRQIVSMPELSLAPKPFSRPVLLEKEKFISHCVAPLIAKGQIKGVLEIFTRRRLDPTKEWLDFFETLATQAAIAIDSATLFNNLQQSNTELRFAYDATIEGWSRALDLRDKETEGHSRRVTEMSLQLADKMGMSDTDKLDLRRGALLHDIGKMGIPDYILLKPGKLTEDEWKIMYTHPTSAYEMLAPISYLKHALDIPYCHHEKWDGTGYPRGLKEKQIPLGARIFAVVDVFDALTSDRPYRSAWRKTDAYQHIREEAGKHFDPDVTEAFLETFRFQEKIPDSMPSL